MRQRLALAFGVKSRTPYVVVLLLFCVLLLVREPQILLKGRIWAEDGKFLQYALHTDFWNMMLLVVPGMGYRILFQNISAYLAAHAVPLEVAPFVFIILGGFLQVLPLILLMWNRVEMDLTPGVFALTALCFLVVTPNYDLWLTTVTSGFLLGAAGVVVLIAPATRARRKWVSCAVLAMGASTGMPTLFLTPFFFLRLWKERERERLIQTSILLFFGVFQAWIVMHGQGGRKFVFSTDGILAAILTNQILLPLFGYDLIIKINPWINTLRAQVAANQLTAGNYVTLVAAVGAFGAGIYKLATSSKRSEPMMMFGVAMVTSVISIVGSFAGIMVISLGADSRYFYVPNLLIAVAAVWSLRYATQLPRPVVYAASVLLAWTLAVGASEYFRFPEYFYNGPSWFNEVAAWRKDPARSMRISPSSAAVRVQPSGDVILSSDSLPGILTGDRFKFPVGLSNGKTFSQRFQARDNGLYELEIEMVTWGRSPQIRNHPVFWEFYTDAQDGHAKLCEGKLNAGDASDWGSLEVPLCRTPLSGGKWFELVLRSPAPDDQSIGVPLFRLDKDDERLGTAIVNGKQEAERVGAKLWLFYSNPTK
jgi:hypothetical protein